MSDPTPTPRPTLLEGTKENTPWYRRPSNIALAVGFLSGVVAELPRWVERILPLVPDDAKPWLKIAAWSCVSLSVIYVRMGVSNTDRKAEVMAQRLEPVVSGPDAPSAAVSNPPTPALPTTPVDDTFPDRTLADVAKERRNLQ